MNVREKLWPYLRLMLAKDVGPKTFQNLVDAFGGVEAAATATPGAWQRVEGIGPKKAEALQAVTEEMIDEELAEADRLSVRIFRIEDDDYPALLKQTSHPPPLLYVRGRFEPADAVALGVVGSRRCTHYGLEQAERFGGLLGRAGVTVISGGARGVDTAAHTGALRAGGRTIAVMGCGLCTHYPPENEKMFENIIAEDRGALVSELPMKTSVLSGNFPTRNRIISGLSLGVLVIEAALPSGALITAREAAEQGREIFAMPGRVDSPMSGGTHQLLRDGAHLAADLDDVLGPLGEVGRKIHPPEPSAEAIPTGLNDMESLLLSALTEGPRNLDDLVQYTGVQTGQAAAAMTMLVLKGAVQQKPGNVFARKKT
jgi:DNA processing protein